MTAFAVAAVMVPKALLSPSYISGSNLHLITHHFLSGVEIQQLERKNYLNKDSIVQRVQCISLTFFHLPLALD